MQSKCSQSDPSDSRRCDSSAKRAKSAFKTDGEMMVGGRLRSPPAFGSCCLGAMVQSCESQEAIEGCA